MEPFFDGFIMGLPFGVLLFVYLEYNYPSPLERQRRIARRQQAIDNWENPNKSEET